MLLSHIVFHSPSIAREWTRTIKRTDLIKCAGVPLFSLLMITFFLNQCSALARMCLSASFKSVHDHYNAPTSRAHNVAGFSKCTKQACKCTYKYALNECSTPIELLEVHLFGVRMCTQKCVDSALHLFSRTWERILLALY